MGTKKILTTLNNWNAMMEVALLNTLLQTDKIV